MARCQGCFVGRLRAARLFVLMVVGCASGEPVDPPLAGCYELRWDLDSVLPPQLVPDAVWLQTDSIGVGVQGVVRRSVEWMFGPDTNQYARGEERPWHKRFYNRWWQVSPDDSIKLELMDEGHLLWEFWLGDVGDSLVGRARLRSHGRGLLTRALIVAYPRECVPPTQRSVG